jgi:hypothetical protein
LRKNLTVHRLYERRIWRPLWYYILDVCAVNSYLIWKGDSKDKNKRGQRRFRDPLIKALINILYSEAQKEHSNIKPMPLPIRDMKEHHWSQFPKRGYCVWCKKNAEQWIPKRARPALADITNNAGSTMRKRQSKTYGGCMTCSAYLCRKGGCFEQYHSNNSTK